MVPAKSLHYIVYIVPVKLCEYPQKEQITGIVVHIIPIGYSRNKSVRTLEWKLKHLLNGIFPLEFYPFLLEWVNERMHEKVLTILVLFSLA